MNPSGPSGAASRSHHVPKTPPSGLQVLNNFNAQQKAQAQQEAQALQATLAQALQKVQAAQRAQAEQSALHVLFQKIIGKLKKSRSK